MEYPIIQNEKVIGQVWSAEDYGQIELWASCPLEEGWIYRLYLRNTSGTQQLYLGVMMPERGRFVLRKKLHKSKCGVLFGADEVIGRVVRHRPGEAEPPQELLTQPKPQSFGPIPLPFSVFRTVEEGDDFVSRIFARSDGRRADIQGRQYYIAPAEISGELGPSPFFSLLTLFEGAERVWWGLMIDENGQVQSLEADTPE